MTALRPVRMIRHQTVSTAARCFGIVIVLAVASAGAAPAVNCPPSPTLSSGVPVAATTDPAAYSVTPALARWSAVGVRAADAMDWDFEARDQTAPYPTCFSGVLANSSSTGIDFAVTDWRFRAAQTDYVGAATAARTGTSARVEYEQVTFDYRANLPFDQVIVGATDVLTVRETRMDAGVRYFLELWPSAGLSGLKCYLFAPVTAGSGWVRKSSRVLEQALIAGSRNVIEYTPSVAGYFGIVVTNENGLAGNFYLTVKHCPFSAHLLLDNAPEFSLFLDEWPGFTPPAKRWGVMGVRGEPGSSYNFDVAPGFRLQNGPYMTCTDSVLSSQSSGIGVRIIAGDFRSNPLRFYTAHMSLEGQPKTLAEGYVEFEDGQDAIVVNAPPAIVNPPAHNVFDTWGVNLVEGGTYNFLLTPDGGATAAYQMLVFKNPSPGTPYWATRPDAVFASAGPGSYAPDATGLYSLVVVNDNGGTGGYSLAVTSTLVGVDPGTTGAGAGRIRNVSPNPSFAGTRIDYELPHAGQASLRVTDVAGRTVVDIAAIPREGGANSLSWNGRASEGTRPPAGVYFVTLYLDGVAQDRAKLIVLR